MYTITPTRGTNQSTFPEEHHIEWFTRGTRAPYRGDWVTIKKGYVRITSGVLHQMGIDGNSGCVQIGFDGEAIYLNCFETDPENGIDTWRMREGHISCAALNFVPESAEGRYGPEFIGPRLLRIALA